MASYEMNIGSLMGIGSSQRISPFPVNLSDVMGAETVLKINPHMINMSAVLQTIAALEQLQTEVRRDFSDVAEFGSSITIDQATLFVSRMSMGSSIDTGLTAIIDLSSVMEMADTVRISHVLDLISTMGLAGAATFEHAKVIALASAMVFGDTIDDQASFIVDVASAMTLRSLLTYGADIDLTSIMTLASAFESRYKTLMEVTEAIDLVASINTEHELTMVFTSAIGIDSALDTQAELQIDLFDALVGRTIFKLGDDVYQGWVFSVEHSAFTEYQNYPFNSFAMYRGKAYGVADDGIYLLEGDDDEGAPIDAAVRTKLTSFRQRALKRCDAAYIGYTSDGKMVLKVIVERDGKLHEHWYQEKLGATEGMRTGRVKIQKGLRSTYWQFELANQDGADFDIEDVTLKYEVLSRRIK